MSYFSSDLRNMETTLILYLFVSIRDPEEDDRLLILILVASFIIISMIIIIGGTACILLCFEESIEEKESKLLAQLCKVRGQHLDCLNIILLRLRGTA